MALSDDDIARIMASIPEPVSDSGNDVAVWATNLCIAIESEAHQQDEALIRQMHGALVSLAQWMAAEVEHFDGATPDTWIIDGVNAALAASRARLESKL